MIAACPFPWPRGTPIRIHRIAEAVARRGHAVHVVTYHLGEDLADPPFIVHRIRDVPAYRRTAPGPTVRKLFQLDPMLAGLLRRLHREIRFDLVHAHHYEGRSSRPTRSGRSRSCTTRIPCWPASCPPIGSASHAAASGRSLRGSTVTCLDAPTASSASARRFATRSSPSAPPRPNACTSFPTEWSGERFPVEPGTTPDGRTVIFTGNLAPYQGVNLMLEAFALLHARRADVRLMIVTDSSFTPFEPLARQLGVLAAVDLRHATFPQQPALLAAAAVAVNPRIRCDGIPQKLLNYMAAGMPIATFEGSAGPLRHEVTGLCVPDGDTAAMAGAMDRLLTDRVLARTLGDAAREQVRCEFSWEQVAARVEQVYRDAIGEAR